MRLESSLQIAYISSSIRNRHPSDEHEEFSKCIYLGNMLPLLGRLGVVGGSCNGCRDVLRLIRLVPEGEDTCPVVEQLLGEQSPVGLLGW